LFTFQSAFLDPKRKIKVPYPSQPKKKTKKNQKNMAPKKITSKAMLAAVEKQKAEEAAKKKQAAAAKAAAEKAKVRPFPTLTTPLLNTLALSFAVNRTQLGPTPKPGHQGKYRLLRMMTRLIRPTSLLSFPALRPLPIPRT